MNSTAYYKTIIALLCVVIAFLGMLLIDSRTNQAAHAGVDSGNGYIAVPVAYSQSSEVLMVVKCIGENKAVMAYECKNGKNIRLVAARRINTDSEIIAYKDNSDKGFHPSELKKELEKINQRESEGR